MKYSLRSPFLVVIPATVVAVIVLLVIPLVLWGWPPNPSFLPRYRKAVSSGFGKIHETTEMEEIFGSSCNHFIGHSSGYSIDTWNTEVVIEGRYELTMQCDVRVNLAYTEIISVESEPKFYLNEITRVDILSDGRTEVTYEGEHREFGPKEWREIVAANGDLSVVGVKFKRAARVPNVEEYVAQIRALRENIRPDLKRNLPNSSAPGPNPPKK